MKKTWVQDLLKQRPANGRLELTDMNFSDRIEKQRDIVSSTTLATNNGKQSLFASNLELNRSLQGKSFLATFSSLLRPSQATDSTSTFTCENKDEILWYVHQLQEELVSLSTESNAYKQDSEVIQSVNMGENDALASIKA